MGKMTHISSRFGHFIGTYPLQTISVTLIICFSALSVFIFRPIIVETDIRHGFVYRNSRSDLEFQRFAAFYNISWKDLEMMAVLIETKHPNETVLKITPQLCDEIRQLELLIQSYEVPNDEEPITYDEFRLPGGNINYFFDAFKFGYDLLTSGSITNESIILTYPQGSIFGHHISLASHFFGVKLIENFTEKGLPTEMESATKIALFFMLRAHGFSQKYRLRQWQLELNEFSKSENYSDSFVFYIYGDQIANAEVERGNLKSLKLFIIGAFLTIIYISCILRMFTTKSKILLILAAIASPLLATIVSFAFMQWLKISLTSVVGFVPLLMLGIGVDDAFLIIHTWQNNSSIMDKKKRMANVVATVGPSISITSITNIFAFAIGSITAPPMISSFCLCMLSAVAMDFILELTIFAPVLAFTTNINHSIDQTKKRYLSHDQWILFSQFVVSKIGLIIIIAVQIVLYVVANVGILHIKVNFDPSKTFPSDSNLIKSIEIVDYIYREYSPIIFIVENPPDISNNTQYLEFMELINKLEQLPTSYGSQRTLLWLRDYVKYFERKKKISGSHNINFTYEYVPEFLTKKFLADKNVLRYHTVNSSSIVVDSFSFILVSRGTESWTQRAHLIDPIRSILDAYPQYNITLFDYDSTIFDLMSIVKRELMKAVIITMACITLICFVFTTKSTPTIAALLTIFSIFYCLMGILSLIGLDLDPMTMIIIIIAIGFSVDYTAHTCYHFYHCDSSVHISNECTNSQIRKLANVYFIIGEPIVEAAISTILCMLPVIVFSTESIASFAKTIVVVVLLGIFHSMLSVPAILSRCRRNTTNKAITTTNCHDIAIKSGSL